MASLSDQTFSWSASVPDFDSRSRHMGNYNMDAQVVNHHTMHPGPTTALVPVCTDVKPRLTKDQHEILEQHFSAQPKPSTSTKKGFADVLGVSLDKINNWFQNRRAKVKQDQKKTLNAMQMYQAHLAQHSQQYLGHSQPIPSALPQYFGPLPVVPSNNQMSSEHLSIVDSDGQSPHTIPLPPSRDGVPAPLEYGMQAPAMGAPLDVMNFVGQHIPVGMTDSPMLYANGFVLQQPLAPDYYNFQFEQQVDPQSMPNVMFELSPMSAPPNSMPLVRSAFPQLGQQDEEKPTFIVESPQDSAMSSYSSSHPTPADSTTTALTADLFEDQKGLTVTFGLDDESPVPTEILSESLDSIFESSTSETDSPISQSAQPSGLAARRQRPRPANLVPNALRSASYSPGMPASPGAPANDQLRRIRSGGIANSGRISKTPGPQKSPIYANLDTAALASPKFRAQHAANFPASSSSSGPLTATTQPGGLAPPTPITPNGLGRFPSWQLPGGKVIHPNGSPSAFSHAGDDAMLVGPSSPLGALDVQQYEQLRANIAARQEALFNTPPQSAPAFQQHFGMTPPFTHGNQSMQSMGKFAAHVRRPSLPENHESDPQGYWQSGPLVHTGNGFMQGNVQLPVGFHPNAISMADTIAMQAACGPSAMAYPYMSGQMFAKPNLHFQNHGPEDFQNGQRPR